MEQLGLYRLIDELKKLAYAAWDYDHIEVRVGAGGVQVNDVGYRKLVHFPFDGRTVQPDIDALDYFRAEILLRTTPSLHEEYVPNGTMGLF